MCGGFSCSKNTLIALNVFYILVGVLLISVGLYGKAASITSLPIIGGIIACGVFLILISGLGLFGAVRHHQVALFFYMIILFILFIIQFSIACSCLAVDATRQKSLAEEGWGSISEGMKAETQEKFNCCGFNSTNSEHPTCTDLPCCGDGRDSTCPKCEPCLPKLMATMDKSFHLAGSLGLFFSFTEFLGVFLTVRYRNQKDPRGNPSAFL